MMPGRGRRGIDRNHFALYSRYFLASAGSVKRCQAVGREKAKKGDWKRVAGDVLKPFPR
jgi:hypothetical protein